MSDRITDHTSRLLALRIEQFKAAENLQGLLESWGAMVQDVEDIIDDLYRNRALDTATGQQLDEIGTIVGEHRGGRSDSDFRTAIKIRIFINASEGDPETVMTALRWITEGTVVHLWEVFPAGVTLQTDGPTAPADLVEKMNQVTSAAILSVFIASTFGISDDPLVFSEVDKTGVTVATNDANGGPLGIEGGYELELSTGAGDYLVTNTGATVLIRAWRDEVNGDGGVLIEGVE